MKAIAAGAGHSLALDVEGHVWAWGRNTLGQAGATASPNPLLKPTQVPGLPLIQAIAARADYSLALDVDGDLWAWGQNTDGELGQGVADIVPHPVPVKVVLPTLAVGDPFIPLAPANPADVYKLASVAAGGHHVLALTRSGRIWGWGRNTYAQVGTGAATEQPVLTPSILRNESVAKAVAAGDNHSLFLRESTASATAWAWGLNSSGQASRVPVPEVGYTDPVFVPFPTHPEGWTFAGGAIAAGQDFSFFVLGEQFNPGQLRTWGNNAFGQLGDGTTTNHPVPSAALRLDASQNTVDADHVFAIAGGTRHGLALREGCPSVWAWGDNSQGQLGTGSISATPALFVQPSLPLRRFYQDVDGDGYGDPHHAEQTCTPSEGYVEELDCDDTQAEIKPGAVEICDGVDNNCDGKVDDNGCAFWYRDADGDGYGDTNDSLQSGIQPQGYVSNATDCDDTKASVRPGASEVCDGVDNNCNAQTDEGVGASWYRDADGDGYGNSSQSTAACGQPTGYVSNAMDCNDANGSIRPGAVEVCDSVDNNCNGQADEGTGTTWYRDADNDGYGNPSSSTLACSRPFGYVSNANDCNDSSSSVGQGSIYYWDGDGDGYGAPIFTKRACTRPSGYAPNDDDCNDSVASAHPGAAELCDGWDNNCNGQSDESGGQTVYYRDADGDGWGNGQVKSYACSIPSGYVYNASDCNDANTSIGEPTVWYLDQDNDGYGHGGHWQYACTKPGGYVSNGIDCHDSNSSINPGRTEVCDGLDNNCNGQVDEGAGSTTWYQDWDGDGYGNPGQPTNACSRPGGYVSNASDCQDGDYYIHPGVPELCDGTDNNCDGQTDEGFGGYYCAPP